MANERIFEIGIALAGGSTRGAYSAGVMDFFIQALNEWEKARIEAETQQPKEPLPPWHVRMKAMTGTSAGGITAAIATSSIGTPTTPLPNNYVVKDPVPAGNNLFKVWVKDVSVDTLFATTDLNPALGRADRKKAVPVKSLLCSDFMPNQASIALETDAVDVPVPRWAHGLELYITTSNLRGIPYSVENFQGATKELSDFRMTRHRDWVGFKTAATSMRKGLFALDLNSERNVGAWKQVKDVAQSTATLPIIFPIKTMKCPTDLYNAKLEWGTPHWPDSMPEEYVYDAVDGGVFRNEPMELLRDAMEYGRPHVLSHNVEDTCGSMILLHPSPKRSGYATEYQPGHSNLLKVLWSLLGAVMEEANFKEEELTEMTAEDDPSRFLVAPVRHARKLGHDVLATDTFHGFGGILGEEIRLHDFRLGRRNCQRFLTNHFVLPYERARKNPIFGEDSVPFTKDIGYGIKVVPIVPLYGSAKEECPMPSWPSFGPKKRKEVHRHVHKVMRKRIHTVFDSLAVSLGFYKNHLWFGAKHGWNFVVRQLVNISTNLVMGTADNATKTALDQFT